MISFQWLQNEKVVIPRTNRYTRGSWYHGPVHTTAHRRSSWAGSRRTRISTRMNTKDEHHTEKKFLGRMWQNTEKYENDHEKWTSHREEVLGLEVAEHRLLRELPRKIDNIQRRSSWAGCGRTPKSTIITRKNEHRISWSAKKQKSTRFIVKTPFKSIPEQELPRKMNIKEVEKAKKCENYHGKPVSDPFKTIAEHRKARELPRKMKIEEVEEPETTKNHLQSPRTPIAATPKLRKFPHKTNMQARNHVNSDEFRQAPRSSTAFYYYRKNRKC